MNHLNQPLIFPGVFTPSLPRWKTSFQGGYISAVRKICRHFSKGWKHLLKLRKPTSATKPPKPQAITTKKQQFSMPRQFCFRWPTFGGGVRKNHDGPHGCASAELSEEKRTSWRPGTSPFMVIFSKGKPSSLHAFFFSSMFLHGKISIYVYRMCFIHHIYIYNTYIYTLYIYVSILPYAWHIFTSGTPSQLNSRPPNSQRHRMIWNSDAWIWSPPWWRNKPRCGDDLRFRHGDTWNATRDSYRKITIFRF